MTITRYQAFTRHLTGSITIGICCAALVFLVWYPWPLPIATGVTTIFLILLAVDVTIGPCITLIVFNPAKKERKELRRDIAIVLLLQIGALLYGIHTVFIARPVYYVFNADRFDLVYANDLTTEKLDKVVNAAFKSLPLLHPEVIGAKRPGTPEERNKVLFSAISGGDDLPQLPEYYVPYADLKQDALIHIRPLEDIKPFNKDRESELASLIGKYASRQGGVGFLPLRGKVEDLTVIVGKDAAEVLEVVNFKPWQ
jgi:hypothetical protein